MTVPSTKISQTILEFGHDPRSVGDHWVREENGEYFFGCEARLNVKDAPAFDQVH